MADDFDPRTLPTLSSLETELDKVYSLHAGPVELQGISGISRHALEGPCEEFHLDSLAAILRTYQTDEITCQRHWPWVAFAASQYRFERDERSRYKADEMKPTDARILFKRIAKQAFSLATDLATLEAHSNRLPDATNPVPRGHLAYLSEALKQRTFGLTDFEVIENGLVMLQGDERQRRFLFVLADLSANAEFIATKEIDAQALDRSRGQADAALPNLVSILRVVWRSLTGRPSATNKHMRGADDRSDFVRFVCSVTETATGHAPTRAEVHKAAKRLPAFTAE